MEDLRVPFFWLASFALMLALGVELGSLGFIPDAKDAGVPQAAQLGDDYSSPGVGVRYLALTDLILLYAMGTMALGMLAPRSLVGRLQGPVALVLGIIGIIVAFFLALAAFQLLTLMIALMVAIPFGTMVYVAAFLPFPKGEVMAALALIMFLKLAFCVLLLLAQQRFLQNKGLVILTALSLGETWLLAFIIGFLPFILTPIADAIGALVFAIVAVVWLIVLSIGSLLNLITVLRSLRH